MNKRKIYLNIIIVAILIIMGCTSESDLLTTEKTSIKAVEQSSQTTAPDDNLLDQPTQSTQTDPPDEIVRSLPTQSTQSNPPDELTQSPPTQPGQTDPPDELIQTSPTQNSQAGLPGTSPPESPPGDPSSPTWDPPALSLEQRLRGIWLIGGTTDGSTYVSEVDLYDPYTEAWYEDVTTFPSPRRNFAIASGRGKIYIIGGTTSNDVGDIVDRVDIFDPSTLTWSTGSTDSDDSQGITLNRASTSVRGAGAVYSHGRIFLLGGYRSTSESIRQVYEYDISDDTWTQRNDPTGISQDREDMAYCIAMGAAFNIGGRDSLYADRNYNYFNYLSYTYTLVGETAQFTPQPGLNSFGSSCKSIGKKIYLTGGSLVFNTNNIPPPTGMDYFYSYDILVNVWNAKPSMSQPRFYHGSAIVDDVLYVFGGSENSFTALDSVEAYDIIEDTDWTTKTAMPRARFGHGATTINMH